MFPEIWLFPSQLIFFCFQTSAGLRCGAGRGGSPGAGGGGRHWGHGAGDSDDDDDDHDDDDDDVMTRTWWTPAWSGWTSVSREQSGSPGPTSTPTGAAGPR